MIFIQFKLTRNTQVQTAHEPCHFPIIIFFNVSSSHDHLHLFVIFFNTSSTLHQSSQTIIQIPSVGRRNKPAAHKLFQSRPSWNWSHSLSSSLRLQLVPPEGGITFELNSS